MATDPYPNGRAMLSALREKARSAHRTGLGTSTQSLQELAVFDRFLCRVFSVDDCPFALKGGTGMLARLPGARRTTDVDLETAEMNIDEAISQLTAAASIDLGDHLEFRYQQHRDTGGPNQPGLQAAEVTYSVTVRGVGTRQPIKVDLAIHKRTPTAPLEEIVPAFRLDLPRLGPIYRYKAIAVEDQIADKACATMSTYGGIPSSRSKDLIDLAILARTASIDARKLRSSVFTEAAHRHLHAFSALAVPRSMTDPYAIGARSVAVLSDLLNPDDAVALVNKMLFPALSGEVEDGRWHPAEQKWITRR